MSFSEIEDGFRLLQSGKNMGKIVFSADDNDKVQVSFREESFLSTSNLGLGHSPKGENSQIQ
jgi:hypothetical protein